MFYIGRYMLMVGMSALQGWDMWMRHWIIPPQLLVMKIGFIGILENTLLEEINLLKDTQFMSSAKRNLTSHNADGLTNGVD